MPLTRVCCPPPAPPWAVLRGRGWTVGAEAPGAHCAQWSVNRFSDRFFSPAWAASLSASHQSAPQLSKVTLSQCTGKRLPARACLPELPAVRLRCRAPTARRQSCLAKLSLRPQVTLVYILVTSRPLVCVSKGRDMTLNKIWFESFKYTPAP